MRVTRAEPLSLEIEEGKSFPNAGRGTRLKFSGDSLPLKWSARWAGMIAGPMDERQNVCRELRFHPKIAEIPGLRR